MAVCGYIHIRNLSVNIEYKISFLICLTIEELKCLEIKSFIIVHIYTYWLLKINLIGL